MVYPILGRPGYSDEKRFSHNYVFRDGHCDYWPGGGTIDVTKSRDATNAAYPGRLPPGHFMGKVTATGRWASAFLGVSTAAYTATGTSLTVSAATGAEIVRRIGASGTFKLIGPPTAAGTNAVTTVTYSAVSGTTVTVSDIGVNKISGSLIGAGDGSEVPLSLIPGGYGLDLFIDSTSVPSVIDWPFIPIAGIIQTTQLPLWPTDTTLRAYIRGSMNTTGKTGFQFSDVVA